MSNYLWLPGGAAADISWSTPDAAALDITSDIDLRAKVRLNTDLEQWHVCKYVTTGNQRSYGLLQTSGSSAINVRLSQDGAAHTLYQSTSTLIDEGVSVGSDVWMRATVNFTSQEILFYYSTDVTNDPDAVSTWTQLGDAVATAYTALHSGTAELSAGYNNGLSYATVGRQYAAAVYDGIDGTKVFHADFTDLTAAEVTAGAFTEDSANAATVTLNGDAWAYVEPYAGGDVLARAELLLDASNQYVAGSPLWPDLSGNNHHAQYGSAAGADTNDPTFVADDGTHPAWFTLTTDDYFEIADHADLDFAANESLTLLVIGQTDDVSPVADQILVAKKDNLTTSAGYALYLEAADDSAKFLIGDSAADDEDATPNLVASTLFTVAGVRDTTADDIEAFLDGTGSGSPVTDSTTLTIANALPLRIGATSNVAGSFFEGVIAAVVLWREALTDDEIASAGELLLGDTPKMLLLGVG
jgi:hypothetical protein